MVRSIPASVAVASIAVAAAALPTPASAAPTLWISDLQNNIGTVDVATGTTRVIGNFGAVGPANSNLVTDIAFDAQGRLWGITLTSLYQIDVGTGRGTLVGNTGLSSLNALAFDPLSGALYATGAENGLFVLDTRTGTGSRVGGVTNSLLNSLGDLAFLGGNLFMTERSSDLLVRVDTSAPAQSSSVGKLSVTGMVGLASDQSALYGVAGTNIYAVNALTGAAAFVRSYANNGLGSVGGAAFRNEAGASVPEPATVALLGLGLAGLGFARRRERR